MFLNEKLQPGISLSIDYEVSQSYIFLSARPDPVMKKKRHHHDDDDDDDDDDRSHHNSRFFTFLFFFSML